MAGLRLRRVAASPWGAELLRSIDIELSPGQVLGIVGPNGAGKSCLLRVLSGEFATGAGEILLGDRQPRDWHRLERARAVALLPQSSTLNFPCRVEDVILLGRAPHRSGAASDRRILEEVLEGTDTLALRERLYTQLSGGERQRVQLARVLAQVWRAEDAPLRLLLLDEPQGGLDLAHRKMVLDLVAGHAGDGAMVVMVMHDFNAVARAADQVLVLDGGRPAALGDPAEVFTEALFREVFGVGVHIHRHPESGSPLMVVD